VYNVDDVSRKIVAAGEFDNETTYAFAVLKKPKKCKKRYCYKTVSTDH
jgi:hypothetical protein